MAGPLTSFGRGMLAPWYRGGPLVSRGEEMEQLLSQLFNDGQLFDGGDVGRLAERIPLSLDMAETDTAVELRIDLPAVKPEEIDIQLSGDTLTISGERKEEREEKGRTYHRLERRAGSFARSIVLPCSVEQDKVDAQYHDGVLTISVPKSEKAKPRKIEVKS